MHFSRVTRRIGLVLTAAVAAVTLSACGGGGSVHLVDAATFADEITKPGVTVIDVRTPAEYAAGHIQGAVNIDVQGDFESAIASLDTSKTYAVYCHSGSRSGMATSIMDGAGFTDVYDLDGGTSMWQAQGYPLVTS